MAGRAHGHLGGFSELFEDALKFLIKSEVLDIFFFLTTLLGFLKLNYVTLWLSGFFIFLSGVVSSFVSMCFKMFFLAGHCLGPGIQ